MTRRKKWLIGIGTFVLLFVAMQANRTYADHRGVEAYGAWTGALGVDVVHLEEEGGARCIVVISVGPPWEVDLLGRIRWPTAYWEDVTIWVGEDIDHGHSGEVKVGDRVCPIGEGSVHGYWRGEHDFWGGQYSFKGVNRYEE